ncbi:alpha/beta hydrolase [Ktedonosporobacter rubrisoli]|uniref:Alpha/beta hydrolase n=1 Tax=Ktedonosporobacter rubrisoli TaxID=2509675 RepID=A0A4P6JL05_KTERU|nr:alpha/beta hydrolase [Ktedonosporobacter rubrisoli]QBD75854.1 alpha/beta hydrolase [Ktedonosporobacter rubrisoli]
MPFVETKDHTSLYYRDWGTGQPVVFLNSLALSGNMWEYQMMPLTNRGLRCVAYDRRGHGRSDDPGRGYDFDTLVDDLAQLINQLDLHEITLVGQSMGCAEIARYLSRHGTSRIARAVLIGTCTPFMLKTEDNPQGAPEEIFEVLLKAQLEDRQHYYRREGLVSYFGSRWPDKEVVSTEMVQWLIQQVLETSPKASVECFRSAWHTDFRPDMQAFTVPTLIIHGDRDQNCPLLYAKLTAQAIPGSQLHVYEGAAHALFLTHKERLNEDLLAFINS